MKINSLRRVYLLLYHTRRQQSFNPLILGLMKFSGNSISDIVCYNIIFYVATICMRTAHTLMPYIDTGKFL